MRLLDAQAVDAEVLAQLGGQHDARLPQALDAIEGVASQPLVQFRDNGAGIPQRANLHVLRQRAPDQLGQ